MNVLGLLPPLELSEKSGSKFLKWAAARKKTKLSVVEAKKAVKILQAMGQSVTSIHLMPDGSFLDSNFKCNV